MKSPRKSSTITVQRITDEPLQWSRGEVTAEVLALLARGYRVTVLQWSRGEVTAEVRVRP